MSVLMPHFLANLMTLKKNARSIKKCRFVKEINTFLKIFLSQIVIEFLNKEKPKECVL